MRLTYVQLNNFFSDHCKYTDPCICEELPGNQNKDKQHLLGTKYPLRLTDRRSPDYLLNPHSASQGCFVLFCFQKCSQQPNRQTFKGNHDLVRLKLKLQVIS